MFKSAEYERAGDLYVYVLVKADDERVLGDRAHRIAVAYTITENGLDIKVHGEPETVCRVVQENNASEDALKWHTYIFGDNVPTVTLNKAVEDPEFLAFLINA